MTKADALALVEGAIRETAAPRQPGVRFLSTSEIFDMDEPTAGELFADGLERWLRSARELHRLKVSYAHAWAYVAKPWLTTLVGWDAAIELGRVAGSTGYDALCAAWTAQWDALEEQSPP